VRGSVGDEIGIDAGGLVLAVGPMATAAMRTAVGIGPDHAGTARLQPASRNSAASNNMARA
jgi:hypothetical protein